MSILKANDHSNDNLLQLYIDINECHKQLNIIVTENSHSWLEYLICYQTYMEKYYEFCHYIFEVKPLIQNDEQIVQLIFYTKTQELDIRMHDKNYYRANLSALIRISNKIINEILNCIFHELISIREIYLLWLMLKSDSCSLVKCVLCKVVYSSYYNQNSPFNKIKIQYRPLLLNLIMDSLILINDYHKNIRISGYEDILNNVYHNDIGIRELESLVFPANKSKLPDYRLFYDACYQLIHGELPLEDTSVKNDVSPVIIKTMIELRIKWGLGISGCFKNGTPIGMSHFFEVIKKFKTSEKIKVVVEVNLIERIYKWSNIFIHGGIRTYSWLPGFALDYLSPLFNNHCGLQVQSKQETLNEFRQALIEKLSQTDPNRTRATLPNIQIEPYPFPPICGDIDEL